MRRGGLEGGIGNAWEEGEAEIRRALEGNLGQNEEGKSAGMGKEIVRQEFARLGPEFPPEGGRFRDRGKWGYRGGEMEVAGEGRRMGIGEGRGETG